MRNWFYAAIGLGRVISNALFQDSSLYRPAGERSSKGHYGTTAPFCVGAQCRGLDAAGQKCFELVGDKGWQACAARFRINNGGEGVEVCLHQALKRGFFDTVAPVAAGVADAAEGDTGRVAVDDGV